MTDAPQTTDASEHPVFVHQAKKEGEICGALRKKGRKGYTRVPPAHFGPKRKEAWLRGYDSGRKRDADA